MYIINKTNILKNVISFYLKSDSNLPLMIWGDPGIGKSAIVKSCNNEHFHLINFAGISSKEDLYGIQPGKTKSGNDTQKFYPLLEYVNTIEDANNYKGNVILFLDEINRNELTLSAAMGLITDRYLGGMKLPDNVKIISAGNDEGNLITLDSASLTRYKHVVFKPTLLDWYRNIKFVNEKFQSAFQTILDAHGNELLYNEYNNEIISGRQLKDLELNLNNSINYSDVILSINLLPDINGLEWLTMLKIELIKSFLNNKYKILYKLLKAFDENNIEEYALEENLNCLLKDVNKSDLNNYYDFIDLTKFKDFKKTLFKNKMQFCYEKIIKVNDNGK